MSNEDDKPDQDSGAPPPAAKEEKKKKPDPDDVELTTLRPYPKVMFFYLTWIMALVCGIVTSLSDKPETAEKMTYIFIWVFTFNLLVVAFEFGRMASVAALFCILAFVFLGLWLGFLAKVFSFLGDIQPHADSNFFFFIFVVFTVIYALVFLQTRFNYWVVRKNELLHKHGFLGDVKRYHAQGVKINKEIPDVLEFLLLRSGSMVLTMEHEDRAIVLENVIGINKKEREVKKILESYAVRIRKD